MDEEGRGRSQSEGAGRAEEESEEDGGEGVLVAADGGRQWEFSHNKNQMSDLEYKINKPILEEIMKRK